MAIIAAMSSRAVAGDEDGNGHEHDLLMPGFRFHPTEEELIEFYLRRKVEGKRFNVELITFLDLYRHDPWELPGLAAIGDKEWYFYVPRDRKYRNGDRPNRVTSSGYWKATGADRMVKSSDGGGGSGRRSIGLKKTLVFYSGKAPRGTRTCWIMNEYRLPHSSTHQFLKTEISLCRVHKRAGVEDRRLHGQALAAGTLRPSSSGGPSEPLNLIDKKHRSSVDSSPAPLLMEMKFPNLLQTAAASNNAVESPMLISDNLYISASSMPNSLRPSTASMEQEASTSSSLALHQYYYPKCSNLIASTNSTHVHEGIDELNSLVGMDQLPNQLLQMPHQQTQLPVAFPVISEKLWEWWNPDLPEAGKGFGTSKLYFK